MESDEIQQITAEVKALAPGETFGAIRVDTMTAGQRADVLDSVQLVLDELRRARPPPDRHRAAQRAREVHALSLA